MSDKAGGLTRRRFLRGAVVGGLGLAGLPFVACTSGGGNAPAPAGGGATAATAAPQVKRGGTVKIPLTANISQLDPTRIYNYTTIYGPGPVYSQLFTWRAQSFGDSEIVGDLVERWEASADGKSYTLHLNPRARWQNLPPLNGRPFTSADVKWNWQYYTNPDIKSPHASYFSDVEAVDTPDEKTVIFRLRQPFAGFLTGLAAAVLKMMPREVFERDGNFEKAVIGTGPFLFERHDPGVVLTLKRNPDYWKTGADGKPLPYVDGLDILILPDPAQITAGLKTGQLSFVSPGGLTIDEAEDFRKNVPNMVIQADYAPTIYLLRINHGAKPFDNVKVRQAIFKAIDHDQLRRDVIRQPNAKLEGMIPIAIKEYAYPQSELEQRYRRDLEGARRLLAEAGLPNGFKTSIIQQFGGTNPTQNALVSVLAQNLKAIGVDAEIVTPPDIAGGSRALNTKSYELIQGTQAFNGDVDAWLYPLWHSKGSINFQNTSDPTLDRMLEEVRAEMDTGKRKQQIKKIQDYLFDIAAWVPITFGEWYLAQDKAIRGWSRHWAWGYAGIENLWFDR